MRRPVVWYICTDDIEQPHTLIFSIDNEGRNFMQTAGMYLPK